MSTLPGARTVKLLARSVVSLCVVCAVGVGATHDAGGGAGFTKEGELVFMSPQGGVRGKIDIEIAETPVDREIGLMVRRELDESQGMLFVFPAEDYLSFWMKNTLLPLDIIFVNAEKNIVTIHRNTVPLAETSYGSTEPARYVVEIVAGLAGRLDIQVGDRVFWQRMEDS